MAKRGKRRIGVLIDMTPMVDIAFLLLIFYMTTTQFKPPEKQQVNLPGSESQYNVPLSDIINITVNKEDQIFLEFIANYVAEKDTMVDGRLLAPGDTTLIRDYIEVETRTLNEEFLKVQARFLAKRVNPMVILKADRASRYGTIKKIMDTLQDININRFSMMTEIRGKAEAIAASGGEG